MYYLDEHVDLMDMEVMIREGLISRRLHPKWPLAILNYTQLAMGKTQDNETLRRCRGLIYDHETMQVVARPMEAFFNVGTNHEASIQTLTDMARGARGGYPGAVMEITEKMDGSMGIIYQYKGNPPEVATRGSFTSEQAWWATAYLQRFKYATPKGYTPIVEIIYPGNQIVVDYCGEESLTLLALIDRDNGDEYDYEAMKRVATDCGMVPHKFCDAEQASHYPMQLVRLYSRTPAQCAAENIRNREGYVFKFFVPGYPIPRRFKVKFEDYRLAHRAMFGMNNRDVWELLKDGKPIDLALFETTTPDFKGWLQDQINYFTREFAERNTRVLALVGEIRRREDTTTESWTRKGAAEFLRAQAGELFSACFACYDGKDYQAAIWKTLRPARATTYKTLCVEVE